MAFERVRLLCLGWFAFHFTLLLAVCCRDTFLVLASGHTFSPASLDLYWNRAEDGVATALGQKLKRENPYREIVGTYSHLAAIEKGYGFFAPAVPNSAKLVFELHHVDGQIEYDLPQVSGQAAGIRLSALLDQIMQTPHEPLREAGVKMLATSAWRQHSDVDSIRAVLGYVRQPPLAEADSSEPSYEVLYAYDFRFDSKTGGDAR